MENKIQPPVGRNTQLREDTQLKRDVVYQSNNLQGKKTKKIIAIILVLVMLGIGGGVVGALYTKAWNPLWNPFRPEPQVVLSKMALKMKELKTFNVEGDFEMEVKYESVNVNVVLDIDRTLIKNPKIKGIIKLPTYLTKIEFMKIDKDFYLELGILSSFLESYLSYFMGEEPTGEPLRLKNRWIKINYESIEDVVEVFSEEMREEIVIGEELSEEEQYELAQKIVQLFVGKKFYEVKEELPDEKIGDQLFYHYLISLNESEIKKVASDIAMLVLEYSPIENYFGREEYVLEIGQGFQRALDEYFKIFGDIDFEVWIGQKDNYLHRLKFEKEGLEEIELILIDINFSEFNQPREIEPPEDFIDMGEILKGIMEKIEEQREEQKKRAASARRQSDLRQISLAMEMYYDDGSKYLQSQYMPNSIGRYIDPVPKDPGNGPCSSYQWISNMSDPQQYCAWACLPDGKFFAASHKGTRELDRAPTGLYCW